MFPIEPGQRSPKYWSIVKTSHETEQRILCQLGERVDSWIYSTPIVAVTKNDVSLTVVTRSGSVYTLPLDAGRYPHIERQELVDVSSNYLEERDD